jgi:hypothetical protein
MTDLEKFEIVENSKGDHYKFVELKETEKEAQGLCEELSQNGFQPASFQRDDNKLYEVFVRFTLAEEIFWCYQHSHCNKCPPELKEDCHPKNCKIKAKLDDVLWKERLHFHALLEHDLKVLRGELKQ